MEAQMNQPSERSIEPRREDEIAESVKITMKALKDFFGPRTTSKQARLRAVGAEFGHIVSRNISSSRDPEVVLSEVAVFWNKHGLGEMHIENGEPVTFTLRNCNDCIGASAGDLCGFKEGFVNAILNDRTGGLGGVEEMECCEAGAKECRFKVRSFHRHLETQ